MSSKIMGTYNRRYKRLHRLIKGALDDDGITNEQLGKMLGCCKTTALARRRHPETLTYQALIQLCATLKVPVEELQACINY